MLRDDLDGWDGGVREAQREGGYLYTQLIHFVVQQKLTQSCKELCSDKNKIDMYMISMLELFLK